MPSQHLPPAQPTYILRGHSCQIHAVHFFAQNSRLLTADAEGWVVSWSLAYKRPVAVWKAHENAVLGARNWGNDRIITHGRDSKLIVWQMKNADESEMDTVLPVDDSSRQRKEPWILHIMTVNTLNFCEFDICNDDRAPLVKPVEIENIIVGHSPILVAVPNTLDSEGIDIFQLPSEVRISTLGSSKTFRTGMAMALAICTFSNHLYLAAGYESGHTLLYRQTTPSTPWQILYSSQPHSQPILSLSLPPTLSRTSYYLTTSADALIVKHPFSSSISPTSLSPPQSEPLKVQQTRHAGQQGVSIRSDGTIFATAGWDARVRVYSAKTLREVAVLKWHKDGCYCVAFATIANSDGSEERMEKIGKREITKTNNEDEAGELVSGSESKNTLVIRQMGEPTGNTMRQRRDNKAQSTHWLAAGSKDGKISLWDIY